MERVTLGLITGAALVAAPLPPSRPLPGAWQKAPTDAPLVLEAQAFLQKQFSILRLGPVEEAFIQRVAGVNVKLVCVATGEDGPAPWEFLAFRSLEGRWRWMSARRTGG